MITEETRFEDFSRNGKTQVTTSVKALKTGIRDGFERGRTTETSSSLNVKNVRSVMTRSLAIALTLVWKSFFVAQDSEGPD